MGSIKMVRIYIDFSKTATETFMEHEQENLYVSTQLPIPRPKVYLLDFGCY